MNQFIKGAGFLALFLLIGAGCNSAVSEQFAELEEEEVAQEEVKEEPVNETTMKGYEFPGVLPDERIAGKQVRITTEKGDIVFELFNETAPNTVSNFVYLSEEGYYDGLNFHRREEGFVIQGGDPNGDGTGGPGYRFEDELDDEYQYERGIVAMANAGPNTNGSQFFVMLGDVALPKAYSIFGRVLEGMEIVDQIAVDDVMSAVVIEEKSE
jgi:cyclophilin family peptidyl-prolyl cis-trans isomerase